MFLGVLCLYVHEFIMPLLVCIFFFLPPICFLKRLRKESKEISVDGEGEVVRIWESLGERKSMIRIYRMKLFSIEIT